MNACSVRAIESDITPTKVHAVVCLPSNYADLQSFHWRCPLCGFRGEPKHECLS